MSLKKTLTKYMSNIHSMLCDLNAAKEHKLERGRNL